jgi:hypothetical protein
VLETSEVNIITLAMLPVMIRYAIKVAYMGQMRRAYEVLDAKPEERAFGGA